MKNVVLFLGMALCLWLASCFGGGDAARAVAAAIPKPASVPAPAPLPHVTPLPPAPPAPELGPAYNLDDQLATWQSVAADARTAELAADESKAQATARLKAANANLKTLAAAKIADQEQKAAEARIVEVGWLLAVTLWVLAVCVLGAGVCFGLSLWLGMPWLARAGAYICGGIAASALLLRGVLLYLPWVLVAIGAAVVVLVLWRVRKAYLAQAVALAEKEAQRLATQAHLADLHGIVSALKPSALGEDADRVSDAIARTARGL